MEKIVIGINQRIPINIIELALLAAFREEASPEYFAELAGTEYTGENRIKKAVTVIGHLTQKNPLFPYLYEHRDMMTVAMKNKSDRPLLMSAVICAAYPFGYDTLALLGKHFHVQDQVSTALITQKMSEKYGSNRSLFNALYCVLPMFIETGILVRPKPSIYERCKTLKSSDFALQVYKQAFLINNPVLSEDDDVESNPFFEFTR